MDLLINVVTAWITVGLMALLMVVYVLRLWIQKSGLPKDAWQRSLNRKLRKPHKWLGLATLLSAFIHGLYSSVAILSVNKGSILFVVFIAMGLSFMFRKQLKALLPWMKLHRYLAAASLVLLLLHFIEVGWFVGIDPVIAAVKRDLNMSSEVSQVIESNDDDLIPSDSPQETRDQDLGNSSNGETARGKHRGQERASTTTSDTSLDAVDMTTTVIPDGTYSGEAVGFQPGLKVDVTVENNLIVSVLVTDHNEVKQQFWSRPVAEIPLAIVESQSTDVDVISGATFTSIGIMEAVKDALASAVNE